MHRGGVLQPTPPAPASFPQPLQENQELVGSQPMSIDALNSSGENGDNVDVLKNKIFGFRDVLGLPPRRVSETIHELLLATLDDLKKVYPKGLSCVQISDLDRGSPYQVVLQFYKILRRGGQLWSEKYQQSEKIEFKEVDLRNFSIKQLGELLLERLDCMTSQMKEIFELMERASSDTSEPEGGQVKQCINPLTPTSVLPERGGSSGNEFPNMAYFPPPLRPLKLNAVGKLKPIDRKRYSFHMLPLVLDQNLHPAYNKGNVVEDIEIDSPEALMDIEPLPSSYMGAEIPGFEATTLSAPSMPRPQESFTASLQTPLMLPQDLPTPSTPITNLKDLSTPSTPITNLQDLSTPSTPITHQQITSLPTIQLLHLRASLLSPTPAPPPSPMFLTGISMFFKSHTQSAMDMDPMECPMIIDNNDHPDSNTLSEAPLYVSEQTPSMLSTLRVSSSTAESLISLPLNKEPTPEVHSTPEVPSTAESPIPLPLNKESILQAPTLSPLKDPPESLSTISSPSLSPLTASAPLAPLLPEGNSVLLLPKGNVSSVPPPPPPPLATGLTIQPPPGLSPLATSSAELRPPSLPPLVAALPTQPPSPPPSLLIASSAQPPSLPSPAASSRQSPPPPLSASSRQSPPSPPPLAVSSTQQSALPSAKGGSSPPPPPQLANALRAKKSNTKLKRSTQMGNLYRLLKGKVEGSSLDGKVARTRKNQSGSNDSDKGLGMADALAEITKRSAYFRQIEEDVEKHAATIMDMKSAISSFETKDKLQLLNFHQHVEKHLENLSDETQVLARFEGFPSKKLEAIRMAAALYAKYATILTTLKDWKLASPIAQQLDKVESYFNKTKEEIDVAERNKEEESKIFRSQKIEFDFSILIRIKESMVDLSSNCLERALKESREAKEMPTEAKSKSSGGKSKMLWRAFQLAFRVYNFAGGQDDRADRLTSELAHEIETCPL